MIRMLQGVKIIEPNVRSNVLLVLDLLRVVFQQTHYRALLQLARSDNLVSSSRNHGLDKVANVTEHNAEALYWVGISRFGLHGLDLYAL